MQRFKIISNKKVGERGQTYKTKPRPSLRLDKFYIGTVLILPSTKKVLMYFIVFVFSDSIKKWPNAIIICLPLEIFKVTYNIAGGVAIMTSVLTHKNV